MNLWFKTMFALISVGLLWVACSGDGDPRELRSPFYISDPTENAIITSFEYTFTGSCFSGDSFSATTDSSDSIIISSLCDSGNFSVKVGFKSGSGTRQITITNGDDSVIRTITFNKTCPSGFIGVPANTTLGISDFCVAKYEMKDAGGSVAVSQAADTPWVSITRPNAETECTDQSWEMLTNAQWQTIARNVESVSANWTAGGVLKQGNNGGTCGAGDTDACYDGANPADRGLDTDQKAMFTLSNGEEIWDLSGNVFEWVVEDVTADLDPNPSLNFNNNFTEFSDAASCAGGACFPTGSLNRDFFAPLGSYDSTQGVGQVFVWTYAGAVHRGGFWSDGADAGAFAASLFVGPGGLSISLGFRCFVLP